MIWAFLVCLLAFAILYQGSQTKFTAGLAGMALTGAVIFGFLSLGELASWLYQFSALQP